MLLQNKLYIHFPSSIVQFRLRSKENSDFKFNIQSTIKSVSSISVNQTRIFSRSNRIMNSDIIIQDGLVSLSRRRRPNMISDLYCLESELESDAESEDDEIWKGKDSRSDNNYNVHLHTDAETQNRGSEIRPQAQAASDPDQIKQLEITSTSGNDSSSTSIRNANVSVKKFGHSISSDPNNIHIPPKLVKSNGDGLLPLPLHFHYIQAQAPIVPSEKKEDPKKYVIPRNKPHVGPTTNLDDELKKEILAYENHFKWILELEPKLTKDRVEMLQDKMKAWLDESTDMHLSCCQKLTQRLQLAVYHAWLENFEEALRWIDEAIKTIAEANENDDEPPVHIRIFSYISQTNKLIILLKRPAPAKAINENEEEIEIEMTRKEIKTIDISGNEVQAAILALKGQLANQLGKSDIFVECFQKAVQLNPECYDWQHHLYTSLRRLRRERDFLSLPTDKENNACHKACDLKPNSWLSYLAMAQLYEDLNRNRHLQPEVRKENIEFIIQQLRGAVQVNPNSISANIRLAEAYENLHTTEDTEKSKALFHECVQKWPTNSQVLHKIGKFYRAIDIKQADVYLSRAMEYDSLNFPCLMDYLRVKQESSCSRTEMIDLLDTFVDVYRFKPVYHGKLQAHKGSLLWSNGNLKEAVDAWTSIFEMKENEFQDSGMVECLKKALEGGRGSPIQKLIRPVALDELKQTISSAIYNCRPNSEKMLCLEKFKKFVESDSIFTNRAHSFGNRTYNSNSNDSRSQSQTRSNWRGERQYQNSRDDPRDSAPIPSGDGERHFDRGDFENGSSRPGYWRYHGVQYGNANNGRSHGSTSTSTDGRQSESGRDWRTGTDSNSRRGCENRHFQENGSNGNGNARRTDYRYLQRSESDTSTSWRGSEREGNSRRGQQINGGSGNRDRIQYDESGRWRKNPEFEPERSRIKYDDKGRWLQNPPE